MALADLDLPKCTRAAIALTDSVVSRRSRAANSSFAGSFLRTTAPTYGLTPLTFVAEKRFQRPKSIGITRAMVGV